MLLWQQRHLSTMEGDRKYIEKCDRKDFAYWLMRTTDYQYQWKWTEDLKGVKQENMSEEDWEEPDRTAFGIIACR